MATSKNMQEILNRIPALSAGELLQLRQRLGALIELTPTHMDNSDERWFLQVICDTASKMGLQRAHTSELLNSRSDLAQFRKRLPALLQFLQLAGRRPAQQCLLEMALMGLASNLHNMQIPVTPKLLMRHVGRLPSIVDMQFPGYAGAGLLPYVIRNRMEDAGVRKKSSQQAIPQSGDIAGQRPVRYHPGRRAGRRPSGNLPPIS